MITAGASRVAPGLPCLHAIAITPVGLRELVRSSVSLVSGLPCETVRSASAIVVSGPAQRSLMLRPARSPSRLATLYIESSDSFVASAAASIATGWSEPVPGRDLHPLKSSAFHGALFQQSISHASVVIDVIPLSQFLGWSLRGPRGTIHGWKIATRNWRGIQELFLPSDVPRCRDGSRVCLWG
jgi:hypothetical protein